MGRETGVSPPPDGEVVDVDEHLLREFEVVDEAHQASGMLGLQHGRVSGVRPRSGSE